MYRSPYENIAYESLLTSPTMPSMSCSSYLDGLWGLALLANTPAPAKYLLYRLEQAARSIGPYVNSDKTEFMCFNQDGAISSLNSKTLKLVVHIHW